MTFNMMQTPLQVLPAAVSLWTSSTVTRMETRPTPTCLLPQQVCILLAPFYLSLVQLVHKAICSSAHMTYAWACLSYLRRQDAACCPVSPTYAVPVGVCCLTPHVVQALQSCPGLLCKTLFEVFGCIFVVALLHLVL